MNEKDIGSRYADLFFHKNKKYEDPDQRSSTRSPAATGLTTCWNIWLQWVGRTPKQHNQHLWSLAFCKPPICITQKLSCSCASSPLPHPFLMPAPHKQGPIPLKPSPQTCAFPPPSSPHVCLLSPIGGYSRFLLTVFSRYKETWKCCTVYSREKGMLYINL